MNSIITVIIVPCNLSSDLQQNLSPALQQNAWKKKKEKEKGTQMQTDADAGFGAIQELLFFFFFNRIFQRTCLVFPMLLHQCQFLVPFSRNVRLGSIISMNAYWLYSLTLSLRVRFPIDVFLELAKSLLTVIASISQICNFQLSPAHPSLLFFQFLVPFLTQGISISW